MQDSRQFVPELVALAHKQEGGRTQLLAPCPGLWREMPEEGALVRAQGQIGWIEVLGVMHRLRAPAGASGVVGGSSGDDRARRPVEYGQALLCLDPEGLAGSSSASVEAGAEVGSDGGSLSFTAPSSGRFYRRPAPDKPNFVEVGQTISRGQTLGLLEVMKTFTRVNYDDPRLPSPAKVVEIVAEDQGDLDQGDAILRVEPA
ncbi:hypothetical protein G6O69_11655 [Pseudenhygromyxa sp. WMMC2535]|uniref:biotin/lipoyl-containing protein n=1 Tax=Pseudenhygromyxa sp. WMMC2535 TaxID=2712867 RepID=UPI001595EC06|nr:biotin/lipoyl-containing protein [Pseudenhygromyxa sp. WMMC2535]NVB38486.1 hypothetical protein [Pseudenhygromyxa sp. WMMC2535]